MSYSREIIEAVKLEVLKETKGMRLANRYASVSGKRMTITLPDRDIDAVFYPAETDNAPLILGFHGGGYLFGGCALNDAMWSETGKVLCAAIASIEYRKSPEYQYMAAIEDAYDALRYFAENAAEYSIDRDRISVMGCSAGAGLAASLCLYAKVQGGPAIDKQILMYPFLDCATDPDSKGEGSIGGPIMYVFNELHCKPEETALPLVSPVFASIDDLKGQPDAIICYADNDNLKNEGQKYAGKLKSAGVPVADIIASGMPHGFYESGFGEISEGEMSFLGEEVKLLIREGVVAQKSRDCLNFIAESYLQ
jgi:acetyl esterase